MNVNGGIANNTSIKQLGRTRTSHCQFCDCGLPLLLADFWTTSGLSAAQRGSHAPGRDPGADAGAAGLRVTYKGILGRLCRTAAWARPRTTYCGSQRGVARAGPGRGQAEVLGGSAPRTRRGGTWAESRSGAGPPAGRQPSEELRASPNQGRPGLALLQAPPIPALFPPGLAPVVL